MKHQFTRNFIFLILSQYAIISSSQNIVVDTMNKTVIVKDSAKVGIIVASKGNTLNVTQNIGQSEKLNKKFDYDKLSASENFDFEYSKKYLSWTCSSFEHGKTKLEISFYFEDDNLLDSFSRIIIQLEESPDDNPKVILREFYVPQKDENLVIVSLRNIKFPYKITCGVILKEDEKNEMKKVYSQHCVLY